MTKKSTKSALLTSSISLILCFAMLLGTTFAWFTDSVTSAGNIIQSGTLDVDLVDDAGNSMAGKIINFVAADGRGQDAILWEPGCTYETQPVYVVNKGNLALKYEIAINGISGDAKLLEAIEWTVTVGGTTTALTDLKGELAPNAKSAAIVLSGHMKEEAGNEYQGLTVEGISIAVFATQLEAELDSFGSDYDKDAIYYDTLVTSAEELYVAVAAAEKSEVIAIDGNITLTKALSRSGLEDVKFVAYSKDATIDQATYNMHFSGATVTFDGLTLTHGEKTYGNGGQTSTAFAVWDASEVNYINCTFNRSVGTIHAKLHNFIGCTFNGVENPGNTKSEYPLYICDGQDYNVTNCVFNCTNRGAILFYNDGGNGTDTLNISNTKFLGNIIADKTAVEIHNNSASQVYNVNIKNVMVGTGIIKGLYRIKPANVGKVNVTVDEDSIITDAVSTEDELADAITAGGDVVLASDVFVDTKLTVASGKEVVLDLGGNELSGAFTQQGVSALIENKGTLTIKNGSLTSLATNPDTDWNPEGFPTYASNTISNSGVLVIEDGAVIENQTNQGGASYAIDNYAGGTLTIKGGEIKAKDVAIRLNTASTGADNNVTIDGGNITGKRAIWVHIAGSNSAQAPKVNLTINGGDFNSTSDLTIYSYSYGQSFANVKATFNGGDFEKSVAFGGGYKGDQETVVVNGGVFHGGIGRYLANDGWEDITTP